MTTDDSRLGPPPLDWEWIEARKRRIFGVSDAALKKQRAFFTELDFQFNVVLAEFNVDIGRDAVDGRFRLLAEVVHILLERTNARGLARPPPIERDPARSGSIERSFVAVSSQQLGLLRKHFGDGHGGLLHNEVATAFERFANGDLRLGSANDLPGKGPADQYLTLDCEPSGDFHFLFAEFAFCAIDLGIDGSDWEKLLPIFVCTEEIMIRAYCPPVGRRRAGQYSPRHFDRNFDSRHDAAAIAALRATYSVLDHEALEQRHIANLRCAYCDEPHGNESDPSGAAPNS